MLQFIKQKKEKAFQIYYESRENKKELFFLHGAYQLIGKILLP